MHNGCNNSMSMGCSGTASVPVTALSSCAPTCALANGWWDTRLTYPAHGEGTHANEPATQAEARLAVFDYLEPWYNPRRHSALDYLSLIAYEKPESVSA